MIYDVLELLINYMQYLYLTVTIDPSSFPSLYSTPFRLVDIVMSALSRSNPTPDIAVSVTNATQTSPAHGTLSGRFGLDLPNWIPNDLRLQFVLTNVLCPIGFVLLTALVLGPPLFTVLVYVLCATVFATVMGSLFLRMRHAPMPSPTITLWRVMHAISERDAVAFTSTAAVVVVLLITFGLFVRIVRVRRQRRRVMNQLRQLRDTPQTVEEHILERFVHDPDDEQEGDMEGLGSTDVGSVRGNRRIDWEAHEVQRAKAELMYHRMLWRKHRSTHTFSLWWTALKVFMAAACAGAAFLFARVKETDALRPIQSSPAYFSVAALLFFLALLLSASAVMGITYAGRCRLFSTKLWLRHMFLSVGLLIISFMYTPILRNAINLFPCREIKNGSINESGTKISMTVSLTSFNAFRTLDAHVTCVRVNALLAASAATTAAAYVVFFASLYAILTWRVLRDLKHYPLASKTSPYSRDLKKFGSGLPRSSNKRGMGTMTTTRTTNVITSSISLTEAPLSATRNEPISQESILPTELEKYYERVHLSQNEARFIYAPYRYSFRYFKLLILAQKTAMVVFSAVMRAGSGLAPPWTGFAACLLLHALMTVVLIVCRPYAAPMEFVVSLALQIVLIAVASMGLGGTLSPSRSHAIPTHLSSFITSCLFVVPCLAVVIGAVLTIRARAALSFSLQKCRNALIRLLGKPTTADLPLWYECCRNGHGEGGIFVPALYFQMSPHVAKGPSMMKKDFQEVSLPSVVCGVGVTDREPFGEHTQPTRRREVHAVLQTALKLGPPPPPSPSPEPLPPPNPPELKPMQRERARRHWAILRASVLSGRATRQLARPRSHTRLPSWRNAPSLLTLPSRAPFGHETTLADTHNYAIATLVASVASANRLEVFGTGGNGANSFSHRLSASVRRQPSTSATCALPSIHTNAERVKERRRSEEESLLGSSPHMQTRQARRQEAFVERVHAIVARQRLLSAYGTYKRRVTQQQRAADCFINSQVASTMRHLFLLLGVIVAVAAALCLGGMLQEEGSDRY